MKYRSRMDVAAAILDIAKDGEKKSKITAGAFLSYPQVKEYLSVLMDGGLLTYAEKPKLYFTTEKGRRLLEMYGEIDAIIPEENMLTKNMRKTRFPPPIRTHP